MRCARHRRALAGIRGHVAGLALAGARPVAAHAVDAIAARAIGLGAARAAIALRAARARHARVGRCTRLAGRAGQAAADAVSGTVVGRTRDRCGCDASALAIALGRRSRTVGRAVRGFADDVVPERAVPGAVAGSGRAATALRLGFARGMSRAGLGSDIECGAHAWMIRQVARTAAVRARRLTTHAVGACRRLTVRSELADVTQDLLRRRDRCPSRAASSRRARATRTDARRAASLALRATATARRGAAGLVLRAALTRHAGRTGAARGARTCVADTALPRTGRTGDACRARSAAAVSGIGRRTHRAARGELRFTPGDRDDTAHRLGDRIGPADSAHPGTKNARTERWPGSH